MRTGITYGKYFYPFRFDHYSDIYFSILREEGESYDISNYDITKEDDRNKITGILSDNLVKFVSEIYDGLTFADDEVDFGDMDSFWKGWNDFLDYVCEQEKLNKML